MAEIWFVRKSSHKREMLHKQAKNYLVIQKVQKYLHAKSDLCWAMTRVNVPSRVTLTFLRLLKLQKFIKTCGDTEEIFLNCGCKCAIKIFMGVGGKGSGLGGGGGNNERCLK